MDVELGVGDGDVVLLEGFDNNAEGIAADLKLIYGVAGDVNLMIARGIS